MKRLTLLLILPLICSCVRHKVKEKPDPRLIGCWASKVADESDKSISDAVRMTFTPEGVIIYEVRRPLSVMHGKPSKIHTYTATYYLSEGYIYTKDESAKEDKAAYKFSNQKKLLLYFNDTPQTLTRINTDLP